jgi:PAS domain S-box-containing protein
MGTMTRLALRDLKGTSMGTERFFNQDDIIVSKTDLKGRLTYANQTFIDISGFTESELIGQPHSILRHPQMPRCVFKLLWDTIGNGKEIFAYVVNRCKNDDYYWVYAHVTPSFDASGQITGYHSNRRVPNRTVVAETITPLYATLLAEEEKHANRKDGMNSAFDMLLGILKSKGVAYDEFLFSLQG